MFANGSQHSAASTCDLPSSQLLISPSEEKYQGRFLGTARN
jgi:hypothetical protein